MARHKKPENENEEQAEIRRRLELVSNNANRSEKTSWNRKMDKMVRLLSRLQPIETQILDLMEKKIPIFDEVQELRNTMVNECVHPFEYLTLKDDHILCKFCDRRIIINDPKKT